MGFLPSTFLNLCFALCVLVAPLISGFANTPVERVLVAGATGRTGSEIRVLLREQGYDVRAMTRDVERAVKRFGNDWAWFEGDVRDEEAMRRAVADVDYVICAIGATERDGPNDPEFVDFRGVANLARASHESGVRHFVLISSAAAGMHRERSTMIEVGNVRYWKTQGENALKASGASYTIIGPGGLEMEPAGKKGLRLLERKDYDTGLIAIGDVAMLAVNALKNPSARNKTFAAISDLTASRDDWLTMLEALPVDALTEEHVDSNPTR